MNPILFLDIDGVLLPGRMYAAPLQTKPLVTVFDPGVVGMLNVLGEECGARFVIHSSWLRTTLHGKASVKDHMVDQGLKAEYFHEDHSCKYRFSGTRWMAIKDWLLDHPGVGPLDYWILEDEHFFGDYDLNPSRVVTTDFNEGLTYAQFQRIYTAETTSDG